MLNDLPKKDVKNNKAKDFIEKCKKIDIQILDSEKNLIIVKSTTKKIMGHLQEMRENVGDANMINITDKIFQRVQLKDIQSRFDYVQKQYKLAIDRIE
jgi:2C-methyl-D-erythritol 2,4-cyclodiphosphate synthase